MTALHLSILASQLTCQGSNQAFRPFWDAIVEGSGEPLTESEILDIVGYDESYFCYTGEPQDSISPAEREARSSDRAASEWSFATSSQSMSSGLSSEQDTSSTSGSQKPSEDGHRSSAGQDRRFVCPFNNANCRGKRRDGDVAFWATKKYNLERHIKNCHGREWDARDQQERRRMLADAEVKCSTSQAKSSVL